MQAPRMETRSSRLALAIAATAATAALCIFAPPAHRIAQFQHVSGKHGRQFGFVHVSDFGADEDKYDTTFSKDRFIDENDDNTGQDYMETAGRLVFMLVDPDIECRVFLHHDNAALSRRRGASIFLS